VEEGSAGGVKHIGVNTWTKLRAQAVFIIAVANTGPCGLQLGRAVEAAVVAHLNNGSTGWSIAATASGTEKVGEAYNSTSSRCTGRDPWRRCGKRSIGESMNSYFRS
jgi:hypothetical protein